MSSYVPTDWVDGSTPLDEAHLDKIEQALTKMPYGPAFSNGRVPVWNGSAWSNQFIFDGQIAAAAAIAISKLKDYPADSTKFLRGDGVWAVVAAGGGGGTDWEGPWVAGTAYVKGDVVTYNGVTYVAVNDSTGQTPPAAQAAPGALPVIPLVTSLPATPFDGQEIIFTDSLTAPTYTWRLRYVAAKASNKWVFIGGIPFTAEVTTQESTTTGATYGDPPTPGPSLTIPVAGEYMLDFSFFSESEGNVGISYMSPKIGAATALDADAAYRKEAGSTPSASASLRKLRRTLAAATVVKMQYRHTTAQTVISQRLLLLTPVAVGG